MNFSLKHLTSGGGLAVCLATFLALTTTPLMGAEEIIVSLADNPAADGPSVISIAGDTVDGLLVPRLNDHRTASASIAKPKAGPQNLGSFNLVIVAGPTLAANAPALAAFNRAAQAWAARISDPITITVNADLAALGAGIIGSTSSVTLEAPYNTIRNQVVVDASDETDDTVVGSLPTAAQFTASVPAATSLSGAVTVSKANAKALGFSGLDAGFGTSDGTITFSTNFSFDFDNTNGVTAGTMDFETVAAHELGHLLGFYSDLDNTNAGDISLTPNTLDLFRFRDGVVNQDPATVAEFTTFPRALIPGGDDITDEVSATFPERKMARGLTNATFPGTDGNQASHWKADEQTGIFIGLMDPTLSFGQFYGPQTSDFRALDLIGYEIASDPEIAVEQPVGSNINTAGSKDFGSVNVGSSADLVFTVKNTGGADLTLSGSPKVAVTSGTEFAVFAQPSSPVAGPSGTTTFTIRFTPSGTSTRSGQISIANNDPSGSESPFIINLTGTGVVTTAPTITSPTSTAVTTTTATLGGNVTSDGGASITERGVVYSVTITNNDPLIGGASVTKVTASGTTGVFTANVSSLTASTGYSFKAYATNSAGTTYTSPVSTFTTAALGTVSSLARVNTTPSNATTVNWLLTFGTGTTGVTSSNFSVSGTGSLGVSIGTPTTANAGLTWNIPVTTGSVSGSLILSLANATNLSQAISTTLPFAGETYTMDKVAPTLSSVHIASNNTTSTLAKVGDVITLTFTSNESIQTPTVAIAGQSASVSNSGNNWTATTTVLAGTTQGAVTMNVAFTDVAGNAGTAVTATSDASAVTVDRTVPTVSSAHLASNNTTSTLAKVGDVISLTFTSSEAIKTPTVTLAGQSASVINSGNNWTATTTVLAGTTQGSVTLNIAFSDLASNAGTAVTATGDASAVTVDRTVPTLSSVHVASSNAASALAKVGDVITLSFTSSEAIKTPTVTIAGQAASVSNPSGNNWTATTTVAAGTAQGTAAINIAFSDLASNAGTAVTATGDSSAVTVDRTPPTLSSVHVASSNAASTRAKLGDVITLTFTSSETIKTPTITLAGQTASVTNPSGNNWSATTTVAAGTAEGGVSMNVAFSDLASNAGTAVTATGDASAVTVDRTVPTLSSVHVTSDNATSTLAKVGDVITLSFTSSEALKTPVVTLAGQTASLTNTSGNNWTATSTVASLTAEGGVTFNVAFSDLASNAGTAVTATGDSSAVTIDRTPPTLPQVLIASNSGNAAYATVGNLITIILTGSEALQTPIVQIAGQTATLASSPGNLWQASITLAAGAPQGSASISIDFSDLAGNAGVTGTTTTDDSTVTIDNILPDITTQPLAKTVNPGADVEFTVEADSLSPKTYQWYRGTNAIEGATANTLSLEDVTEGDQDSYYVVVTSVAGGSSSDVIQLSVNDPIVITQPPQTQLVNQNETATFTVAATGTDPITYQWRRNGDDIDGANQATYKILSAQSSDEDFYDVVVSNIVGPEESDSAELVVFRGAPKIVTQPASRTVTPGMGAGFSVEVVGSGPFTYQWRKKKVAIEHAILPNFNISSATAADAADYTVTITNSFGSITSDIAKLTVLKAATYVFSTLAGTPGSSGAANETGAAARFAKPESVVVDSMGDFFVADRNNHLIRKVTAAGVATTFAGMTGTFGTADGTGTEAQFSSPAGLAIDADDNLYVADSGSHLIRKITPEGEVTTVAGTANVAGAGNDVGTAATFRNPWGIAVDATNQLYVADSGNHVIRKIALDGTVTTLTGLAGTSGVADGNSAVARLNKPTALATDGTFLYVADEGNHAIRKVSLTGDVTTFAGVKGTSGVTDAVGILAKFKSPGGIAVDASGNVFVGDTGNQLMRMITPGGIVTTIGGLAGKTGSANGAGSIARFNGLRGLTVDAEGVLCLADTLNHTIRRGAMLELPQVVEQPESLLVEEGEEVTFEVVANAAPDLEYQWYKGTTLIKDAIGASYTIPITTLASAGSYSVLIKNDAGSVTSIAARLGVVNMDPQTVIAKEDSAATLKVQAAGDGLVYLWLQGGEPAGGAGFTGMEAASLVIKPVKVAHAGAYTCLVRLGDLRLESEEVTLSVFNLPPEFDVATGTIISPSIVGGDFSYQVPIDDAETKLATKFTATGLPPGLTINALTGEITGYPTAASASGSPYRITITASNGSGKNSVTLLLTVLPLPEKVVGTFNGLADRDTTLSAPVATPADLTLQGHGGSLYNLVISSSGVFTGTLLLEDKSYAMPKGSSIRMIADATPMASVRILRGTATDAIADLTFEFSIDKNTGKLEGTVTDGLPASTPIPVVAWRNKWKTTGTTASPANPASALAGNYTAVLALDPDLQGYADHPEYPQGKGYVTLKVTTAGVATWGGKLADGTAVTGGTTLGPDGQVPLQLMLYTPKLASTAGSAHGWVQATADSLISPLNDGHPLLDGEVDWLKLPQLAANKTRSYKGGFDLHTLTVTGGFYSAPEANDPVLGLTDLGLNTNNAVLSFSEADLISSALAAPGSPAGSDAGVLNQLLRITNANAVLMPKGTANPGSVTLSLAAKTGVISGKFTLKDTPSGFAPVTRATSWFGILVPRLAQGVGQFQLPQLPVGGANPTTPATSPMLSGQVLLEAAQ